MAKPSSSVDGEGDTRGSEGSAVEKAVAKYDLDDRPPHPGHEERLVKLPIYF